MNSLRSLRLCGEKPTHETRFTAENAETAEIHLDSSAFSVSLR